MKVILTKELNAFVYNDNKEELKKFFADNKLELLSIKEDEGYVLIYYIDSMYEAHSIEVQNGWYLIFDQDNVELSSCAPDYFKDYYKIVDN